MQIQIDRETASGLVQQRIDEARRLVGSVGRNSDADAWSIKVQHSLGRIYGDNAEWIARFTHRPGAVSMRDSLRSAASAKAAVERTVAKLEGLLEIIAESEELGPTASTGSDQAARSSKIFVVHGHDDAMREAVARYLERLGYQPVILHEQANRGRTIIEKVEAHGDVGFAIVLLSPDDVGRAIADADLETRARQNVLLELGYFMGRLGRANVCALMRGVVQFPSDFAGVVYTPFDEAGGWKTRIAQELQDVGYNIDWNKVMGRAGS